jgi:hypothetical protein
MRVALSRKHKITPPVRSHMYNTYEEYTIVYYTVLLYIYRVSCSPHNIYV